jgi:hypothetical protein
VLSEKVVDAIKSRRFLVTTDEELARAQTLSRLEEIGGTDPVLPPIAP